MLPHCAYTFAAFVAALLPLHAPAAAAPPGRSERIDVKPATNHFAELVDALLEIPAPAPDWAAQARARNAALPVAERDWFEGAPPEEASPDVLLPYWADLRWIREGDEPAPTDRIRQKLLRGCARKPHLLSEVLPFLPDTPDAHEEVARLLEAAVDQDEFWREAVVEWLAIHSQSLRPQLIELARSAQDKDDWVLNEDPLRALAERDWAAAEPMLRENLAGTQPGVAAVSLALLYEHACCAGDEAAADIYRERLKALAADRAAPGLARGAALEALMVNTWAGRDDWFLALFSEMQCSDLFSQHTSAPRRALYTTPPSRPWHNSTLRTHERMRCVPCYRGSRTRAGR